MDRAVELAKQYGIGVVALGNNNHWMRGGSYGWQAADQGCIGICWSNTQPNMPAWGGIDKKIGNNPFIMAIPRLSLIHIYPGGITPYAKKLIGYAQAKFDGKDR